jgi:hypothetical protein
MFITYDDPSVGIINKLCNICLTVENNPDPFVFEIIALNISSTSLKFFHQEEKRGIPTLYLHPIQQIYREAPYHLNVVPPQICQFVGPILHIHPNVTSP